MRNSSNNPINPPIVAPSSPSILNNPSKRVPGRSLSRAGVASRRSSAVYFPLPNGEILASPQPNSDGFTPYPNISHPNAQSNAQTMSSTQLSFDPSPYPELPRVNSRTAPIISSATPSSPFAPQQPAASRSRAPLASPFPMHTPGGLLQTSGQARSRSRQPQQTRCRYSSRRNFPRKFRRKYSGVRRCWFKCIPCVIGAGGAGCGYSYSRSERCSGKTKRIKPEKSFKCGCCH